MIKFDDKFEREKFINHIISYLLSDDYIKRNIISIYLIGGIVRGSNIISDIDLNFFIKNDDVDFILKLKDTLIKIEKLENIKIDTNVLTKKELKYMNTWLFIHKFRHALLLYELKMYKYLVYWKDILENFIINKYELFFDTFKIINMLFYRLKKDFLAKWWDISSLKKELVKFFIYSCEFLLINFWYIQKYKSFEELKLKYKNILLTNGYLYDSYIDLIFDIYINKKYDTIDLLKVYNLLDYNRDILSDRFDKLLNNDNLLSTIDNLFKHWSKKEKKYFLSYFNNIKWLIFNDYLMNE